MRCAACHGEFTDGVLICPSCGEEAGLGEDSDPLLGRVLSSKFRVIEEIGVGGMGRVYRAEQMPLGIDVVVKVLQPSLASDQEIVNRFFREGKAAAMLRHPNSIHIIDFGESEGTLYLAMEYLRGRPLDVVLDEDGQFPIDRVVDIATQVLSVLDAAHRASIVHRDLKPENIMIENVAGRRDFVKVVDFGIAKMLDPLRGEDAKLTKTGSILGTPAYMAPEQVLAESVDTRTDFYALGVICFEMLTGRQPFEGDRVSDILRAHISRPPPSIKELRPEVPDALARAVDDALAKDPGSRPQTADAFKRQLTSFRDQRSESRTISESKRAAAVKCPGCGTATLSGGKFCRECGAPLVAADDRFAELRNVIPTDIIDSVADVDRSAGSSRRDVIVAAFDISAVSLEGEPHSRVNAFITALRAELRDIIVANQGMFEARLAGPALAIFGVTRSLADDAELAARTALEARERIVAAGERAGYRASLSGSIHSGAATIDSRGGGPAFTPIDDLVELPARLVALGEPGRITISETIRQRIGRVARLRRLQPVRLLGRTAAVACYELISIGGASAVQGLAAPPLVGRDALLERCVRASGVVELRGELGSGKSRVLAELTRRLQEAGKAVLSTRAGASDALIAAITRSLGGVEAIRTSGAPPDSCELLERWTTGSLTGALTRERLDSAIAVALHTALAHRGEGPDAIVIDDLHHARGVAAELVTTLACEPLDNLTIVVANRDGHPPPWNGRQPPATVEVVELPVLEPANIAEIVRGALAPTHAPQWLVDHVVSSAGGSPLLAMQLIASLVDAGIIGRRSWGWNIESRPPAMPAVAGIAELLGQRVEALPDLARRVLHAVATATCDDARTDRADRALVAAVVGVKADHFDEALGELRNRQLITTTPGEIEIPSAVLRDVAYRAIGKRERQTWHGALAMEMSLRGGDEETIAAHFTGAGEHQRAFEWLERATSRVLDAAEPARAAILFELALATAKTLDDGGDAGRARVARVSLQLGEQWLRIGELDKLAELLADALPIARNTDDQPLVARLQRLRARTLLARSDADRALRELDDVISTALALHDAHLYAEAHADLGEVHEARGELDKSAECLVRALELSQKGDERAIREVALRVLNALGRVQIRRGDLDRARDFLEQALSLADEADDSIAAARALGNLAGVHHARGDWRAAIELAERALARSRSCGDQMGAARQLNNLGTLGSLAGDLDGARQHFDDAYQMARRIGWREGMATAAAGRQRVSR